jgi:hypothetical protein
MNNPDTTPKSTQPEQPSFEGLDETPCSVSVGAGQHAAAALWKTFKDHELTYADMLEAAACLIVNVADKTESTDHEIHSYVWKLTTGMRANAARSSKPNR